MPSVNEYFARWSAALRGLKRLGVVRTVNSPVSDYAEWLVAKAYGGDLQPSSYKSVDVVAGRLKLQVKARWLATGKRDSRMLGAIRGLDNAGFTHIAAVLFGPRFDVQEAFLIPRATVMRCATFHKHVNAHRLVLGKKFCTLRDVKDITAKLQQIASAT